MKNPYAIGKSIYLRAPIIEDVKGDWYQWFSDPESTQYLADRYWPNTVESQMEFYEATKTSKERLVLSVCLIDSDEHIGVCNLSSINWFHRYADVAFVVGNKEHRNATVAIEIMALLLETAFKRLNLLNLRSAHNNKHPVTPLIEKMFGFKEVGRFEEFLFYKGEYVDFIYSQLSKKDWLLRNESSISST